MNPSSSTFCVTSARCLTSLSLPCSLSSPGPPCGAVTRILHMNPVPGTPVSNAINDMVNQASPLSSKIIPCQQRRSQARGSGKGGSGRETQQQKSRQLESLFLRGPRDSALAASEDAHPTLTNSPLPPAGCTVGKRVGPGFRFPVGSPQAGCTPQVTVTHGSFRWLPFLYQSVC